MRYALGVDVGTSFTAAAVWRWDGRQPNKAEVVALDSRMPSVPSVLFLGADGAVVVGAAAERRALTDPDRVVREFKRRIGDDTPLVLGGQPYAAHDLAAMMVRWVVDRVAEREGGLPDRIAITHPAGWGPFKKDLLSHALSAVGLDDLTFLAEPEAAAVSYAAQERVEAGTTIAVYDLGGGTFDAAVVRKTGAGSFALLGSASGLEQLGGADFDEAVFTYVQAALGAQSDTTQPDTTQPEMTQPEMTQPEMTQWDALDVEDPSVLRGLARLRRECTEAKETLSSDTEVSIPVLLPGISAQVRMVRSEFEEMIRPSLEDTVDSLSRAIRSAELNSGDLGAVLLVGGSSRVPLVSQLVSSRLGCPVVVDADPKTTIALGAALSMAPQTQAAPTTTVAAPPATDSDPSTSREHLPNRMPDQTPDRPPIIVAQRELEEDPESTDDDASLRRRIVTGQLRNIVGAGLLAGVLLISLAVAAPGGGFPGFTDWLSGTAPGSVDAPGGAVADSSGAPAVTGNAGSPTVTGSGRKATKVAPVSSDARGGRVTAPVPPPPSLPLSPIPAPTPKPIPTQNPIPTPTPKPDPTPTPAPDPPPDPTPTPKPDPTPTLAPDPTPTPTPAPDPTPTPTPTEEPLSSTA